MLLHHNTVRLKIQAGTGAMAKKKHRIIIKNKVLNKGQTAAGLCYSLQKEKISSRNRNSLETPFRYSDKISKE